MDKRLKTIVAATREEMESFARKHTYIGFQGSDLDLSCYCAIASYFLVMVGRKLGYKLTLVEGIAFEGPPPDCDEDDDEENVDNANHCWVEHGGKIIDLSAMQFDPNLDRVHVVDIGDYDYWPLKRNNAVRKNLKDEWPTDQSPYRYIKELRKRANRLSISLA